MDPLGGTTDLLARRPADRSDPAPYLVPLLIPSPPSSMPYSLCLCHGEDLSKQLLRDWDVFRWWQRGFRGVGVERVAIGGGEVTGES